MRRDGMKTEGCALHLNIDIGLVKKVILAEVNYHRMLPFFFSNFSFTLYFIFPKKRVNENSVTSLLIGVPGGFRTCSTSGTLSHKIQAGACRASCRRGGDLQSGKCPLTDGLSAVPPPPDGILYVVVPHDPLKDLKCVPHVSCLKPLKHSIRSRESCA